MLEYERRSHSATKGLLTKERNRTLAGLCPCCDKHYVSLAKHIKTQHPEFNPEPPPS